ncbi:MAG: DEAD/DEAH box helicase family protein [Firmicutes bacterium]|nr:DEAD/DEAH box helicase family protein [Bacillota bacterium]
MRCLRCKNEDTRFFYNDQGIWYCRKCIAFGRVNVGDCVQPAILSKTKWRGDIKLQYPLTPHQKMCSELVIQYLKQGKSVFLYAATGAGKTEVSMGSIAYYLHQGKKVCFAISRRQVVLEIRDRLQEAFEDLDVIAVTQGYTEITDGDIIVCTTHQLYRYPQSFDLLILDEVDAFPYANDPLLKEIAKNSCKGEILLLSATPDLESLKAIQEKRMEMVNLFERPHKHPLIVPKIVHLPKIFQVVYILIFCLEMKKKEKQVLVFVPKKQDTYWLSSLFQLFIPCAGIHSSSEDKDSILDAFRKKKLYVLFSTTLLERGITIPSVQVLVYEAEHSVFTTASLIQIFGRIGRSFQDPTGIGVCLCQSTSPSINECISQIQAMNDTVYCATKE